MLRDVRFMIIPRLAGHRSDGLRVGQSISGGCLMSSEAVFAPSAEVVARSYVNAEQYEQMYARSSTDPDGFWGEQAQRLDWITPFTKVKNTSFDWPDISIKWFEDGALNVAANCID